MRQARKKLSKKKSLSTNSRTPEALLVKDLKTFFNEHQIYARRLNTTGIPMKMKDGRIILRPNPEEEGTADFIVHLPMRDREGCRTIYLECKASDGEQAPQQEFFEYRVKRAGCEYYAVRALEEVVAILEQRQ